MSKSGGKRLFEILDEMNVEDTDKGSDMVMVANTFVSGRKVKQGAIIEMGCAERALIDVTTGKYIPLLVFVKKEEYDKRK